MLLANQRNDEAVVDARLALAQMPFSAWAYTTVAQAEWELGNPDRAISALQDALKLNPLNHHVRMRLTTCLLEVGRNAEARRISAPLARMLPDDETAQNLYKHAQSALAAERARSKSPTVSVGQ
jgi:predicted Zn-dependent protease